VLSLFEHFPKREQRGNVSLSALSTVVRGRPGCSSAVAYPHANKAINYENLSSTCKIRNAAPPYPTEEIRYKAWGEQRYGSADPTTNRLFTGQLREKLLGGSEGLYFYGSRYVDVSLGRFTQADSLIPEASQGTQAWDRYAYGNNNPVKYNDPTGHIACDGKSELECSSSTWDFTKKELKDAIEYEFGIDKETEEFEDLELDDLTDFYRDPIQYTLREDSKINAHELQEICEPNTNCQFNFETEVKWEEFTDVLAVTDLVKIGGAMTFTLVLTGIMGVAVIGACIDPLTCAAAGVLMGPNIVLTGYATALLYKGTREYFIEEFTKTEVWSK